MAKIVKTDLGELMQFLRNGDHAGSIVVKPLSGPFAKMKIKEIELAWDRFVTVSITVKPKKRRS